MRVRDAMIVFVLFAMPLVSSCASERVLVVNFSDLRSDFLAMEAALSENAWRDAAADGAEMSRDLGRVARPELAMNCKTGEKGRS